MVFGCSSSQLDFEIERDSLEDSLDDSPGDSPGDSLEGLWFFSNWIVQMQQTPPLRRSPVNRFTSLLAFIKLYNL